MFTNNLVACINDLESIKIHVALSSGCLDKNYSAFLLWADLELESYGNGKHI